VSATSCDDDTTERGRMSIRTRFLGRRLRTLTGRVAAAISSGGAAMGPRKELGARCREEVEAAEGRCCPDRTAIEITGAGWRGGQASGGSGAEGKHDAMGIQKHDVRSAPCGMHREMADR
jgi:hypothetical protein